MIQGILHVGLTVSDIDRSVAFYKDCLGLSYLGELCMEGKETDRLFQKENAKARVAYLNGSDAIAAPPIELIQFVDTKARKSKADLFKTSVSEICFYTSDIAADYQRLLRHGVECLSAPQEFDFTAQGFGKSLALYFKDPDGILLELMQTL